MPNPSSHYETKSAGLSPALQRLIAKANADALPFADANAARRKAIVGHIDSVTDMLFQAAQAHQERADALFRAAELLAAECDRLDRPGIRA